jgi:hypothetical protein
VLNRTHALQEGDLILRPPERDESAGLGFYPPAVLEVKVDRPLRLYADELTQLRDAIDEALA